MTTRIFAGCVDTPSETKREQSARIARQVEEFLKGGGKPLDVPRGVSALVKNKGDFKSLPLQLGKS